MYVFASLLMWTGLTTLALHSVIICIHVTILMHTGFINISVLLTVFWAPLTFHNRFKHTKHWSAVNYKPLLGSRTAACVTLRVTSWRRSAEQNKSLSRINQKLFKSSLCLPYFLFSSNLWLAYFWCLIRVYLNVWFNFQYCV